MIKVRVVDAKVIGQKLAAVREALDYDRNAELFRTIQLSSFQERALEFIRSITPVGKNSTWYESLGVKGPTKATMPLRDSWRVERFSTSTYIGFEIRSILEKAGKRGQAKLYSIEYGNKPTAYFAKRRFSFFSTQRGDWTTVLAGEKIERPMREGLHLTQKTSEYIQFMLMPEIREKVSSIIRSRMLRFT